MLALGSVHRLKAELDAAGLRTPQRRHRDGSCSGGAAFSRGKLYALLANPLFIGRIRHHQEVHLGQHPAIVDEALWQAVQDRLAANRQSRSRRGAAERPSPLAGRLFDPDGRKMRPSHARRKGRRYRYYLSTDLVVGSVATGASGWRIPAGEIEAAVGSAVAARLREPGFLSDVLQFSPSAPEAAPFDPVGGDVGSPCRLLRLEWVELVAIIFGVSLLRERRNACFDQKLPPGSGGPSSGCTGGREDAGARGDTEGCKAGANFPDHLLRVLPRRLERATAFYSIAEDSRSGAAHEVSGVCIVVTSSGCRIEGERLAKLVWGSAGRGDGVVHHRAELDQLVEVVRRHKFAVGVALTPTLAVEGRVAKRHVGVGGLVLVKAPRVVDRRHVAVNVDEPSSRRMLVDQPDDVARLWLGCGLGPDVDLRVAGIGRGANPGVGREVPLEIPERVEVAVDVDPDAGDVRTDLAPVLAPHRLDGLAVVPTVGIDAREER